MAVSCGSQPARPAVGAAKGEPVPAHVGQALALTMAIDELGITPASAQATWGVNGTLKDSIGAPSGQDMPAIVLYQAGNSNVFVNGIRIGIAHYALAKKFTAIEYWDWSENYVELDPSPIIGDFPYWNGNWRVFLSDYYDMTFGAFRLRR